MALVSKRRVEVPHEPGEWFDLRQLSWADRQAAREARQAASLAQIKALGPDLLRDLRSAERSATDDDPANEYDTATILRAAVAAWSYDQPVTAETLGQLDELTAVWVIREALGITASETDRKNG